LTVFIALDVAIDVVAFQESLEQRSFNAAIADRHHYELIFHRSFIGWVGVWIAWWIAWWIVWGHTLIVGDSLYRGKSRTNR
jgi:hypothetical protein